MRTSFLILLLVAGLSAPADAEPFRDTPAWWHLKETGTFDCTYIGYGADVAEQVIALRILLERDDAAQVFAALLEEAEHPAGKLYALCGLWLTDPAACQRALPALAKVHDRVSAMTGGCGVSELRVSTIVRAPDALRLRGPADTIAAWAKREGHEDSRWFECDIAGGGYPASFRRRPLGWSRKALQELPPAQRQPGYWVELLRRDAWEGALDPDERFARFGPAAIGALAPLLRSKQTALRQRAAHALVGLELEDVRGEARRLAGVLGPALSDPDPVVRQVALGKLENLFDWTGPAVEHALAALERVGADADLEQEETAEWVKGLLQVMVGARPPRAEALRRAFRHPNPAVVTQAVSYAYGLGRGARRLVPELLSFLRSGRPDQQRKAFGVLAYLGPRPPDEALAPLAAGLTSEDSELRALACVGLAAAGEAARDHAARVRPLLRDPDEDVRRLAARALWLITASPEAIGHLVQSARAKDARGRGYRYLRTLTRSAAGRAGLLAYLAQHETDADACELVLAAIGEAGLEARDVAPRLRAFARADHKAISAPAADALFEVAGDPAPGLRLYAADLRSADSERAKRAAARLWCYGEAAEPLLPDAVYALGCFPELAQDVADLCVALGPKAARALPALVRALDTAKGRALARVCRAIGALGEPARSALPRLRKELASDPEWEVVLALREAIKALERP